MKSIMLVLILFMAISVQKICTANAGGSEAHGGDAVVCFSDLAMAPFDRNTRQLTPYGRAHIKSAVPLDLYRAGLSPRKNPRIAAVVDADYLTVLKTLYGTFMSTPGFALQIRSAHQVLGDIETRGFATESGLPDVNDSGLELPLPPHCAQIQAAARQGDQILYDPAIWERFTPFGRAILQLHEELYYLASDLLLTAEGSSVGTQLLISSILTEEVSPQELSVKLSRYGFRPKKEDKASRFVTREEWEIARRWLIDQTHQALTAYGFDGRAVHPNLPVLFSLYMGLTDSAISTPIGSYYGALGTFRHNLTRVLNDWKNQSYYHHHYDKLIASLEQLAALQPGE